MCIFVCGALEDKFVTLSLSVILFKKTEMKSLFNFMRNAHQRLDSTQKKHVKHSIVFGLISVDSVSIQFTYKCHLHETVRSPHKKLNVISISQYEGKGLFNGSNTKENKGSFEGISEKCRSRVKTVQTIRKCIRLSVCNYTIEQSK